MTGYNMQLLSQEQVIPEDTNNRQVIILQGDDKIMFMLRGPVLKDIHDFQDTLGAKKVRKQIEWGLKPDSQIWDRELAEILIEKEKNGKAEPYMGPISSIRYPMFEFYLQQNGIMIKIINQPKDPVREFNFGNHEIIKARITSLTEPYLMKWYQEKSTGLYENGSIAFCISDKSLASLRQWDWWVENEALTPDYVYKFATLSIGTVIKVGHLPSGKDIDLSGYENW
jgi:hypothetical protein